MADFTILSLCSGYGGLDLAVEAVMPPGARVVAYVERDSYAAAILLARMADASLAPAPVWCGDLAELPVAPFLGVDLVTAGFPCQPWSSAGRGRGTDDDRWIWPDIAGLLRAVRPRAVFLENVPLLVTRGGLGLVLADLAALGFDAEWTCLRASDVGAPHERERVFILAHAGRPRGSAFTGGPSTDEGEHAGGCAVSGHVAHGDVEDVADRDGAGRQGRSTGPWGGAGFEHGSSTWPPGPDDLDAWRRVAPGAQPSLRRDADGSAYWLGTAHASRDDQLRLLGNGVVPQQAAAALRILIDRIGGLR